jgi:hypothetical protein
MSGKSRSRVFLAYSLSDDTARALRKILSESFDIVSPEMLTGRIERRDALRQRLLVTDVAIVIFPPVSDPAWRNVVFEAGMASGVGLPLVLVGDSTSVPADLKGSLIFEPTQTDQISNLVRDFSTSDRILYARPQIPSLVFRESIWDSNRDFSSPESRSPAISGEYASSWLEQASEAVDERTAINLASELFRNAGARVHAEQHLGRPGAVTAPDLALWHDDLLTTFGLPLPVEVLLHARSWPAIRQRLEKTLESAGGQTLVAIAFQGEPQPEVWTDGRHTILLIPATILARYLAITSLPNALSTLLTYAVAA